MPFENWNRARDLFAEVLDLPTAEREPFLVAACGADVALLGELRQLLSAYDGESALELLPPLAEPTIELPATSSFATRTVDANGAVHFPLPSMVGPYRVIGVLGAGGMGVVFRAQDPDGGRVVALETVRVMSESLLAGIRREIHALARLRHPGIVRVLDVGVDGGCPGMPWSS